MEKTVTTVSQMKKRASVNTTWLLKDWTTCHKLLVREASCSIKMKNNVHLRFFLCPVEKSEKFRSKIKSETLINKWYSLRVQLISYHHQLSIKVKTEIEKLNDSHFNRKITFDSAVFIEKSASNQKGVETVQEEFLLAGRWKLDSDNGLRYNAFQTNDDPLDIDAQQLIINIEVTMFDLVESNEPILQRSPSKAVNFNEEQQWEGLPKRIRSMLREDAQLFSDIQFLMKDNVILHGHKVILAGVSPVFKAMFSSDMKESKSSIVPVPDISSTEMKIILEYIYTGKVSSSCLQNIAEVIYASEKYQLTGLLDHCSKLMITMCDAESAMELLKIAKQYNLSKAVEELMEYCRIHATEILMAQLRTD